MLAERDEKIRELKEAVGEKDAEMEQLKETVRMLQEKLSSTENLTFKEEKHYETEEIHKEVHEEVHEDVNEDIHELQLEDQN